jgi:DNA primase
MGKRYSKKMLRMLRNAIPVDLVIADLLKQPNKISEGYFRFLCPNCGEFNTAVNPKTNLGRCFSCKKNFNPIDIVMSVKTYSFTQAVEYLMMVARLH